MKVIDDTYDKEYRLKHRNKASGIDDVRSALVSVRPPERHPARGLQNASPSEILASPLAAIGLKDWADYLLYRWQVKTVADLLAGGWARIYAQKGIGDRTLWIFTDALASVGLEWPEWTMNGHVHPARRK